MTYSPFIWPLFLSSSLAYATAVYAWRKRETAGARMFAILQSAMGTWALLEAFRVMAPDTGTGITTLKLVHTSIQAVGPSYLFFALDYSGFTNIRRRVLPYLLLVPCASALLLWTNDAHHLFWRDVVRTTETGFSGFEIIHGPAGWTQIAITYLELVLGVILLGRMFLTAPALYRRQIVASTAALLIPFAVNVIHVLKLDGITGLDPTPFSFGFSSAVLAFGLFRAGMLDVAPIALDAVIETMRDAIVVLDVRDRIVSANPPAEKILGDRFDTLVGTTLEDSRPDVAEALPEPGAATQIECALDVSGEQRHFSIHHAPLMTGETRTGRMLVFHDVTTRIQAREALEESERKHRQVINAVSDIIFTIDLRGNFTYANRAGIRLLGYSNAQLMRLNISDIVVNPGDLAYLREEMSTAARGGRVRGRYEYLVRRRNGTTRMLEFSYTAQRNQRRRVIGFFGVARDVTERKAAEEELRRMKEEAEAASQAKSEFLANMTHELRTPMNAILGYAQILAADPSLAAHHRRDVETIRNSGEHLLALINSILDLSKIEAGREELSEAPFDLGALLTGLGDMFRIRCKEKDIGWSLNAPGLEGRHVRGDEGKLRQVLINLLGNAVKFTEVGFVSLRVTEAPAADGDGAPGYHFEVTDSGPGIPPERQQTIFDPFRQDEQGRRQGGTGLGLAIARRHVALMGGELGLESEVGRGARFHFALSLAPASAEEASPRHGGDWQRVCGIAEGRRVYALIVDDVPDNRDLLVRILRRAGVETATAENGQEAVWKVRTRKPDIIYMDIRMPVMDGTQAFERMRQDHGDAAPPVVAVTTSVFEHQREMYLEQGFHGFIDKPVSLDAVYHVLSELLDVRFLFHDAPEPVAEQDEPSWDGVTLPSSVAHDLRAALDNASITEIRRAIESLRAAGSAEAALADHLGDLASRYDLDAITTLLDQISPT